MSFYIQPTVSEHDNIYLNVVVKDSGDYCVKSVSNAVDFTSVFSIPLPFNLQRLEDQDTLNKAIHQLTADELDELLLLVFTRLTSLAEPNVLNCYGWMHRERFTNILDEYLLMMTDLFDEDVDFDVFERETHQILDCLVC